MKRNWFRILFILTVLSFLALACGAGGPLMSLFATATPTSTVTPSITPSPTPTLTPTATLTPTPIPTGVQKTEQSDGSTLVTDYDAGLRLEISKDWLVVPVTVKDLQALSKSLEASNPDMAKAMRSIQTVGSDAMRLMAFNQDKTTHEGTMVTNLNVVIQQQEMLLAMPLDFFIELNAEQIKSALPGTKILSSGVTQNAQGVEMGYIELELKANTTSGQSVTAYEKMVVVKTKTAMSIITFAGPKNRQADLIPIFDKVIDTIQLLEP